MTHDQYRRVTAADMKSKRWRTLSEIKTAGGKTLLAGSIVRLTLKRGGFTIVTPKCDHCGVTFECRKVHWMEIEEVP